MPGKNIRIVIPRNAEEKLALSKLCYSKHVDDGAASPLNAMETHKWETNGPAIAECLDLHKKAEELRRQMEQTYAKRNKLLTDITISLKSSRDILSGVYSQNPKHIGDWGFGVHDARHHPKHNDDPPPTP